MRVYARKYNCSHGEQECDPCRHERMKKYKRDWAREHQGLRGRKKSNKNQNTDKTHCVRGHEFTEENTYVKGAHRICIECRNRSAREKAQRDMKDPVKKSKLQLRRRKLQLKNIGWTPEMFSAKFSEQGEKCGICSRELNLEDRRRFAHADHKHINPPKPRGILCHNCNLGIGNLQEDERVLLAAIEYLRRYN